MELEIVKSEKDDFELKLNNITIAELLRVYLNNVPEVNFVAWKREHISKPALLKVQTTGKSAKKAIGEAISSIMKDSNDILVGLKKK